MRLKQHITEQHTDGTLSVEQATFTFFITNILRDCKPFIRELDMNNPKFLYSGRKRDTDWFEQNVRNDRQPKDLAPDIHNDFDDEFMKQHGWRARSNSLFCSGLEAFSYEYGNTYMIFPKKQYKFLWSDEVGDLFMHLKNYVRGADFSRNGNGLYQYIFNVVEFEHTQKNDFSKDGITVEVSARYYEFISDLVETYKSTDLKRAIDSHKEIMINCQSYYAVRYNRWFDTVRDFFKVFGNTWPDSDDLDIWYKGRKK
jgi:hypothetical protein